MNDHLTVRDLTARLRKAERSCTLLGVGPVSEVVIRATFQSCTHFKCPTIFIASRNQVDLKELGHGYLMGGMDQPAFVDALRRIGTESGYKGCIYICRDHGGPWQRNTELDEKYSVDRAMEIARQSFRADIEAGFNYLHIDPTKCPHPYTQEDLVERTVDLVAYCESTRKELKQNAIDYEVGTEDIRGGLTTTETYEAFLQKLTTRLHSDGLPAPTCVVGQTGTLCKIDRNVGNFDARGTAQLVKIAARYGVGFKEHNGDYMPEASCRLHPELGVTGMNVAPEFGLVETDALLTLADIETNLIHKGALAESESSNLRTLFIEKTFAESPWKKWMTNDIKKLPPDQIESDAAMRLLIARVCGHYVYDHPEVEEGRAKLYTNLDRHKAIEEPDSTAEGFILARVRAAIDFYLQHFNVDGINDI